MSNRYWEFDWYYFGDFITLAEWIKSGHHYLIDVLIRMPKEKAADILRGVDGTLFSEIKKIREIDQRFKYKWEKDFSLMLKVCNFNTKAYGLSFLTPNTIYLDWPFRHPRGHDLYNHVKDVFSPCPASDVNFVETQHLSIDRSFNAIDKLIHHSVKKISADNKKASDKNRDWRKDFEEAETCEARRGVVIDFAQEVLGVDDFTLPECSHFRIMVDKDMHSWKTTLKRIGDSELTLFVGLIVEDPEFERWPDGAFE